MTVSAGAGARPFLLLRWWPIVALAAIVLALIAMIEPSSHDEGQYVSAAYFVARGLMPYRDFAYLQTPLQPFVYAPLAWLFPGWSLVATRLANAIATALGAALIARTAAVLARRPEAAWWAFVAVLTCDSVLFGASVARNDALPFALFALGLERLFAADRPGVARVAAAGLALALAASTKVSYALPTAAIALMALWHARTGDRARVAALFAGMFVGALPTLIALVLLTRPFLFGVYHYSIDAVIGWQALSGQNIRLGWTRRLREFVLLAMLGPAVWAAIAIGATKGRPGPRPLGVGLWPVALAALIAAVLPMPTYRHYLIPMIGPLVLIGALHADAIRTRLASNRTRGRIGYAILALSMLAGIGRSVVWPVTKPGDRRPIALELAAHEIGRLAQGQSDLAGLDPLLLVDSGIPFDPRFAPGPFLFRAGNVAECADPSLCPVTYAALGAIDRAMPGGILTGTERRAPKAFAGGLDGVLDRWALRHGYRPIALPHGQRLWLSRR